MKTNYTISNMLVAILLVVSFVGFLDATYLAAKHYLGIPVTCSLFEGCEKVTSSQYAIVLGVPLALLGSLYYLTLVICLISYVDRKRSDLAWVIKNITIIGFITSLILIYIQVQVIHALCIYCLGSALSSTALFAASRFIRSQSLAGST